MRLNLTKGPTITPALMPVPDPITGGMNIVGFSGMSELDYAAIHILCAYITHKDAPSDEALIQQSITMALRLLNKTNEINNRRAENNSSSENESPIIPG